jgi:phage regulator Rha-like protein
MANYNIVPVATVERRILLIRGQKVILDADLADLYGTTTKRLKEQVRRNRERFPLDFLFELTFNEKAKVVANCDHLKNLKFSPYLPFAFTEHGALMLANVLNSQKAIQVSVQIIRTFIRLREMLASNEQLARKLTELENKYDEQFRAVFEAVRQLLQPSEKPKHEIGFKISEQTVPYKIRKRK